MKERPILFSTPMVEAILDGRKTVTRRIVKMPKEDITEATWGYTCFTPEGHISFRAKHQNGTYGESFVKMKYGKKGEVLWVRETWAKVAHSSYRQSNGVLQMPLDEHDCAVFKAGWDRSGPGRWKPSIHMPKKACRLRLTVLSVRVEHLHDITEEDAKREGAPMYVPGHGVITNNDLISDPGYLNYISYKMGFEHLWYDINGKESWDANPWVWRIEFEKL